MSIDPFVKDLLRQPRGYGRRRGVFWRRVVAVCLVLAALAAYLLFAHAPEREPPGRAQTQRAVDRAQLLLGAGVEAARAPLRVELPERAASSDEGQDPARFEEGTPATLRGELAPDESVFLALQRRGLSDRAIHEVVSATSKEFNFRRSRPGDGWEAQVNAAGEVTTFRYKTSPEDIWETRRQAKGTYRCQKLEVPLDTREHVVGGEVSGSLWQSMEDAGLSAPVVGKFIDVFAYDLDFGAETQPGDRFALVFERIYLNGEELRAGKILAARYVSRSGVHEAFFYEADDGERAYYDRDGTSLQRQFLKSPLANVRITSRYGRRFHPVLKRWKMHAGIDYGAPRGTPVMSVADGRVVWAGHKGANGKLVSIRHGNGYTTHYAHLSSIPRDIKRGRKVTRKTTIGYVGSTGRSTGPHLHFGMSRGGRHLNPLEADFVRGEPLEGAALESYRAEVVEARTAQLDEALEEAGAETIGAGLWDGDGAAIFAGE